MDAGTVLRWLAKAAGLAVLIWYSRVWKREWYSSPIRARARRYRSPRRQRTC